MVRTYERDLRRWRELGEAPVNVAEAVPEVAARSGEGATTATAPDVEPPASNEQRNSFFATGEVAAQVAAQVHSTVAPALNALVEPSEDGDEDQGLADSPRPSPSPSCSRSTRSCPSPTEDRQASASTLLPGRTGPAATIAWRSVFWISALPVIDSRERSRRECSHLHRMHQGYGYTGNGTSVS